MFQIKGKASAGTKICIGHCTLRGERVRSTWGRFEARVGRKKGR